MFIEIYPFNSRYIAILATGGVYALVLGVFGLVVPFSYFANMWAERKLYVFYVSFFL